MKLVRMGSRWLRMGPQSVRTKHTSSRNPSKPLRDPWDPQKIKKIPIFRENPDNPGIPYIPYYSRSGGCLLFPRGIGYRDRYRDIGYRDRGALGPWGERKIGGPFKGKIGGLLPLQPTNQPTKFQDFYPTVGSRPGQAGIRE